MNKVEPNNVTILPYAPVTQRERNWGKGLLALCATFAIPGLGHLISRRYSRGVFWVLVATGCQLTAVLLANPRLTLPALLLGPLVVIVYLALYIDAFRCGRRSAKPILRSALARYAVGAGVLLGTYFFHPWGAFTEFLVDRVLAGRVRTFSISSGSMLPTLSPRDRLIAHSASALKRWDIVIFYSPINPNVPYVARIAGLPGETVEIVDGSITVAVKVVPPPSGVGRYVSYPYSGDKNGDLAGRPGAGCEGNPIKLGKDEYYLLGDNSPRALDARLWEIPFPGHQLGATPVEQILYRASAVHWPPKHWRVFPMPD